jgi:hypothetical protein
VLVACLSLLAIAVVAADGHPLEGPAASSALHVGDAVKSLVVVVAGLAAIGGVVIAVYAFAVAPRGARMTRTARPKKRWLTVVLAMLVTVAILLLLRTAQDNSTAPDEVPDGTATGTTDAGPTVSTAMWVLLGLGAAVAVALTVAMVMSRRVAARTGLEPGAATTPTLLETIDASIDDLEAEGSPRAAVLAAYARLLEGLDEHGLGRAPEETPQHHLRRALAELPVRAGPAQRLVDLFLEARFSTHPIGPAERDAARAALVSVRNDLATAMAPVDEPA